MDSHKETHPRNLRFSRRGWVVLVAIGAMVGLAVAGLHGSVSTAQSAAQPGDHPLLFASSVGHRSPIATPGALAPQMLAAALRRNPRSLVRRAAIGTRPSIPGLRPGIWLDFVVDAPSNDERAARALWDVDLTVGALADALAQAGRLGIAGVSVDAQLPDNTTAPLAGGIGDVVPGQSFSNANDEVIRADLTQGLKAANLKPLSIDIVRVDQPAPAIVAETTDARAAATAVAQTTGLLFGKDPPRYEGYYFEVRDMSGKRVFIRSAAFRSGVSAAWASPAVADVFPLGHR